MSKIFDLINKSCSEGVKFDELGVICKSLTKGTLKQEDLIDKGAHPVVNSSRDYYGFYDKYNNEANAFTIASRGEYAGFVKFIDCKFWAGGLCYPYTSNDEDYVLTKFIFYFLKSIEKKNMDILVARGSIPALNKSDIDKVKIPVPPMEVQREIVRIMDSFTSLTEELMAKLTEELTARKKQYEFYRDFLLSFDELDKNGGCELKTLGEICELIRGNGLQKKDFVESGVPAIHYGQIYTYYGTFASKTKSFVSVDTARRLKKATKGDVLISGVSENIQDILKPLGWLGEEIAISGDMFALRPNKVVNTKFLTYMLQTNSFYKFKEKHAQGAKVTRVKSDRFLKFKIPVPSLQTQQKVVDILDKFDTLVNSITDGLPREIELRRKQYEHYRELLLNFKPKMTA